ncbi:MAG: YdcF family protein [Candidatus Saccharibacteria bacterium]
MPIKKLWQRIKKTLCEAINDITALAGGLFNKIGPWTRFIIIAVFLVCAVVEYDVISFGMTAQPVESDCIIIMGCRLYGTVPSPFLRARMDEGIRLYREGYCRYIIVSGGKGPGESISEAQCMRLYLASHGVSSRAILIEDESRSSTENLKYSAVIMKRYDIRTAVIVSNRFHLRRAAYIAKRCGINASYSGVFVSTYIFDEMFGFVREVPALAKTCIENH